MLRAQCARCLARGSAEDRFLVKVVCQGCKKKMPARDFGPAELKTLYTGLWTKDRWRCFECKYPPCKQCGGRPVFAVPHNALESGVYYCMPCRFPPCVVCGKDRPQSSKYRAQVLPEWTCEDCQKGVERGSLENFTDCRKHPPCAKCCERPVFAVPHNALESGVYYCTPCRFPPCVVCGKERPQSSKYRAQELPEWTCEGCQKPSATEKMQLCTACQQELPISAFAKSKNWEISKRCTNCLVQVGGKCFKCSAPRKRSAGAAAVQKRNYFCSDKCKFPPCAAKGCWTKRPQIPKYAYDQLTEWRCEKHRR